MNRLFIAILLSIAPISELRGGMPLAIKYALDNHLSLIPIILLIIFANIAVMFFIFFFLDNIHCKLLRFKTYEDVYNSYLRRIQKKVDRIEEKNKSYGLFLALLLFVAVPLPGTGAWTGTIISWVLDLDRKRSLIAIATGVIIAGILIALASLGIFSLI